MFQLDLITAWAGSLYLSVRNRLASKDNQRGDVPGWVMVTVMTAGLVVAIFAIFKSRIQDAVSGAIDSVTSGTK